MASITKVNGKWRALVRRKGHASKCKTFGTKAQAAEWARQIESDLDRGVATPVENHSITIGKAIEVYRDLRDRSKPISDASNEHYMLKHLTAALGNRAVVGVSPQDLVDFATLRKEDGAGPYTVNMELSKLGTVLRYSSAYMGVTFPDVVGSARPLLSYLGLIGGGGKRERRPTEDELRRVVEFLRDKRGQRYADVVEFAAHSAMRRGEMCEILWKDLDREKRLIGVWRKHPRKSKVWEQVPLLGDAWEILMRQPQDDERIFPLYAGTVSKYFTDACRELGIPDLHLHDLRHEGTSRLFEDGLAIQQVALVTGHKSWQHLRRYTNLRPEDLTRQQSQPSRPGDEQAPDSRTTASRRPRKSSPAESQR